MLIYCVVQEEFYMFLVCPRVDDCFELWYNSWSCSQRGGFGFAGIVWEEGGENIPVAAHLHFPSQGGNSQIFFGWGFVIFTYVSKGLLVGKADRPVSEETTHGPSMQLCSGSIPWRMARRVWQFSHSFLFRFLKNFISPNGIRVPSVDIKWYNPFLVHSVISIISLFCTFPLLQEPFVFHPGPVKHNYYSFQSSSCLKCFRICWYPGDERLSQAAPSCCMHGMELRAIRSVQPKGASQEPSATRWLVVLTLGPNCSFALLTSCWDNRNIFSAS